MESPPANSQTAIERDSQGASGKQNTKALAPAFFTVTRSSAMPPADMKGSNMQIPARLNALGRGINTFAVDVAAGFFQVSHNGFALLGLAVVCAVALLVARPDLRHQGEEQLTSWLKARQAAQVGFEAEPVASRRATAANPVDLPPEQANAVQWISRKYRVAPEPVAALVAEAYETGQRVRLDPTLILAVMAVESSFNPFAQSNVGAQGLMQVMTKVHTDKYEDFGGNFAAFDPVSNLRVGIRVLKDCTTRFGSTAGGLKCYVGAANMEDDGGYAAKVMAEHARIYRAATGRALPAAASEEALRAKASATGTAPASADALTQAGSLAESSASPVNPSSRKSRNAISVASAF